MAFLLRGGPRDRQLVDDLPRGYSAAGPLPMDPDLGDVPVDAAVWVGGEVRRSMARRRR